MMTSKNELREKYKLIRSKLTVGERETMDIAICGNLFASAAFCNAPAVFCFIGTGEEINTRPIFEKAWELGKITAAPVITGKGLMEFRSMTDFNGLEQNRFGILEPVGGEVLEPDERSVVIVPGLVFGENMTRIGYGGGYYDRYFCGKTDVVTIGIIYDCQIMPCLQKEEHDMILKGIITEYKKY